MQGENIDKICLSLLVKECFFLDSFHLFTDKTVRADKT